MPLKWIGGTINAGGWMANQGIWLPRRVRTAVTSEVFGDGTAVVVELDSQQAHGLDALAATVWELADGTRSVTAVALAADVPTDRVEATLAQLDGLGLLEDDGVGGHSRRSVLARAAQLGGGLVVAGGVINSMALPAAADAVSNVYQSVEITYSAGTFSYQDGSASGTVAPSVYLTDMGVSPALPPTPFVQIRASGSTLDLVLQSVNGATASYGNGTDASSATSSLTSGVEVTPTVGTGDSALWVTIGT